MKISTVVSPVGYLFLLWIIYAYSFIQSPLGWHSDVNLTHKYIGVYSIYSISLIVFYYAASTFYSRHIHFYETNYNELLGKSGWLFYVVSSFCVCRLIALQSIPLFGSLSARYDTGLSLGGFIDLTSTLANPLAIVFFVAFMDTQKTRFLIRFLVLLVLQLMFFRRFDTIMIVFGGIVAFQYYKKYNIIQMMILVLVSFIFGYFLLGVAAVLRAGGPDYISRSVELYALPFWVTVSDLTGATKLGYKVLELTGAGNLNFNYTLGVFPSIFGSDRPHGAGYIMQQFTNSTTAQSVAAPLSYYLDGAMPYVVGLGAVHGFIWGYLRQGLGNKLLTATLSTLCFFQAIWSIRSGAVLFAPSRLFEALALVYLLREKAPASSPFSLRLVFDFALYACILVSTAFLLIRLPHVL